MTNRKTLACRLMLPAAILAAAGLLGACSSQDTDDHDDHADHSAAASSPATASPGAASASAAAQVDGADVDFATMMIPHHRQAVEMADLVPSRTQNAWLIAFAQQVKDAQQPEIEQLTRALQSWGKPVPAAGDDAGHHHMDGMMTPEQMTNLESLSGEAFDREWITMMIDHHEGAVAMAKDELARGANPEMRGLAQQIVDTQQTEIAELRKQLDN